MKNLQWKNAEGLQLHAQHWPVDDPQAVIALVHGQGEHFGRYQHLAQWYNTHDVAVLGFDQQGYGRSEGQRGHAKDAEVLLDDIGLLLEKARELYPKTPLFLYGHSMGGNLTLNYVLRRTPALQGLIATSPWIRLAFEAPALKVMAGRLLRKFMPTLSLPTGLAANFLSHNEAVVQAYKNDPLVHDKLSAAAGIALMEAADWLNRFGGVVTVPLLLLHGTGDKIISPAATKEFAGRVAGDVTHHEWPGLYHELHNEAEQFEVFEYTLAWMRRRLGA
jgi:alpha-beta hydrolase superfamily lysophospholipase